MKLRSQMLLAGTLTLAVPLVGWQSVKQLYSSLQQTRIDEQTLKVANIRLAMSEAEQVDRALELGQTSESVNDWFAESAKFPLFVDGYADDWQTLSAPAKQYSHGSLTAQSSTDKPSTSIRMTRRGERLFLMISIKDNNVIYHQPPVLKSDAGEGELPDMQTRLVNGDAVELLIQSPAGRWQHGLFRAIAPGPVRALTASTGVLDHRRMIPAGRQIDQWQAVWVQSASGYQLELSLPLPPMASPVGVSVVDVDRQSGSRHHFVGNISPQSMSETHANDRLAASDHLGLLFYENEAVRTRLLSWTTPGVRARLFDVNGRLLADVNKLNTVNEFQDEADAQASTSRGLLSALLHRVFAFFIAGDLPLLPESYQKSSTLKLDEQRRATVVGDSPVTSRYVTEENDRVLGTLAPLGVESRRGYLLIEANEEHSSAYAGSQVAQLFSLLLLVSLLAGSGLLVFATVLSARIRRLSRQAQQAIAADGRVRGLPGSDARDEIGELSRKLSVLLSRSAAYTQYLEALSGRLSHELRTPLSVVRTSIENLDRESLDTQSRMLIDRASGGAEQLKSIIQALVESTRLEQTVQLAQMHSVNLLEWLEGSLLRYQQVHSDYEFVLSVSAPQSMSVNASPELLQQAFDKLVENAVGFAVDKRVVLHMSLDEADSALKGHDRQVVLAVENRGSPIDEAALEQLFDPMYSNRSHVSNDLHLGLGLYIVRMIAEAHEGMVFAENRDSRVFVGIKLPLK